MQLSASNVGGQVVITGSRYGSAASFTTAYTPGGADGTAQLGIAANTYAGTDVAGTIGGLAATGAGLILTGAAGGPTEGLGITYSGTAIGAVGEFTFTLGVSGMLYNAADVIGRPGGVITSQNEVIERTINDIKGRADTVQQSLDRRRQALIRQFVEMERAISQIQAQGGAITNFLSQLQAQNN
jgi:flagellar hook-associated protein 2